eukprot:624466-Pyramimonas_sp.AAC.1
MLGERGALRPGRRARFLSSRPASAGEERGSAGEVGVHGLPSCSGVPEEWTITAGSELDEGDGATGSPLRPLGAAGGPLRGATTSGVSGATSMRAVMPSPLERGGELPGAAGWARGAASLGLASRARAQSGDLVARRWHGGLVKLRGEKVGECPTPSFQSGSGERKRKR